MTVKEERRSWLRKQTLKYRIYIVVRDALMVPFSVWIYMDEKKHPKIYRWFFRRWIGILRFELTLYRRYGIGLR